MGKISDLWVRLGLKKNDFDRGMDDAVKKAKKGGNELEKAWKKAKAGWLAVSAAVLGFGRELINATNRVGDAWGHTMSSIRSGWRSVLADISNYKPDFSSIGGFFKNEASWFRKTFGNAKEAADAGREMSEAFDAEFELINSVKLQKSMISNQLNELYVKMRDTTLSPSDRKAAAERYKSLLQPLADAEIRIYGNMMEAAAKEWQAGAGLSRQYSSQELTDFFSLYGTDAAKATAIFPELQKTYETRKGDQANQAIFDTAIKLAEAQAEMSRVDKEIARTYMSIKKSIEGMFNIGSDTSDIYLKKTLKEIKDDVAEDVRAINEGLKDIGDVDIEIDLTDIDNDINAFLEDWKDGVEQVATLNNMLEDSIVQSMSNGLQAITDMIVGLEGADMDNALAAFIAPFGDTMRQMGAMIMSEGIAMVAFKESFKNPATAIAAGAALMAIGSMVSSGLQKMIQNPVGGGSAGSYGGTSTSSPALNYESTLNVEVTGKISGNDIVLSGKKTNDKNRR